MRLFWKIRARQLFEAYGLLPCLGGSNLERKCSKCRLNIYKVFLLSYGRTQGSAPTYILFIFNFSLLIIHLIFVGRQRCPPLHIAFLYIFSTIQEKKSAMLTSKNKLRLIQFLKLFKRILWIKNFHHFMPFCFEHPPRQTFYWNFFRQNWQRIP